MSDTLCFLSAVELRGHPAQGDFAGRGGPRRAGSRRAPAARTELHDHRLRRRSAAAARSAEQAGDGRRALGPLHGIPFTVKDIVNTRGVRTTFGAVPMRDNVPG
ncbi:amidase family protein [Cupriavidus basilensis]